jgi:chemotaxis protein methyltransferase CheR
MTGADVTRLGETDLDALLEAVYQRYAYDFRQYARASMRRRVASALAVFGLPSVGDLTAAVVADATAFARLLSILTVPVSEFFRDPPYFRALRHHVLPTLATYPTPRVWIAGCSTGEEVYSLAILLDEAGLLSRTLIYATDINPQALRTARAGVYALDRVASFTRQYHSAGGTRELSAYYTAAYAGAVFDRRLLERVVFTDHCLATDAAFAEVQFVSCRNVLIYFTRALQQRAVGLFRESLVRRGFLGLGSRESLGFTAHADAFEVVDPSARLYRSRA